MDPISVAAIAGLLVSLSAFLGFTLGRYVWPSVRGEDPDALRAAQLEAARLGERVAMFERQLAERTEFKSEFENIANRILSDSSAKLSQGSQQELRALLDPLRERIQDFQKKVEATYESESREVLSLKEQIRLVLETSNSVGSQADSLAKALRGDSQLLGRWGEIALERILETAGLSEGREYVSQGRGLDLRNEMGGLQKPDIVIFLPGQRTMIIDSKISLAGYERLIAAGDKSAEASLGAQFVRDIKVHIDGLAGKRYQENSTLPAHDCVLMFVSIEGALAAALRRDPELFSYAWARHVVLVGPATLLMTMRTVDAIWRYERQGENTQEIARLAGELIDKVALSLEDLNLVAGKLAEAEEAHNQAVKRLSSGRGNALSIGERIRALGVKSRRQMPAMVIDGRAVTPGDLEDDAPREAAE